MNILVLKIFFLCLTFFRYYALSFNIKSWVLLILCIESKKTLEIRIISNIYDTVM